MDKEEDELEEGKLKGQWERKLGGYREERAVRL